MQFKRSSSPGTRVIDQEGGNVLEKPGRFERLRWAVGRRPVDLDSLRLLTVRPPRTSPADLQGIGRMPGALTGPKLGLRVPSAPAPAAAQPVRRGPAVGAQVRIVSELAPQCGRVGAVVEEDLYGGIPLFKVVGDGVSGWYSGVELAPAAAPVLARTEAGR